MRTLRSESNNAMTSRSLQRRKCFVKRASKFQLKKLHALYPKINIELFDDFFKIVHITGTNNFDGNPLLSSTFIGSKVHVYRTTVFPRVVLGCAKVNIPKKIYKRQILAEKGLKLPVCLARSKSLKIKCKFYILAV